MLVAVTPGTLLLLLLPLLLHWNYYYWSLMVHGPVEVVRCWGCCH